MPDVREDAAPGQRRPARIAVYFSPVRITQSCSQSAHSTEYPVRVASPSPYSLPRDPPTDGPGVGDAESMWGDGPRPLGGWSGRPTGRPGGHHG